MPATSSLSRQPAPPVGGARADAVAAAPADLSASGGGPRLSPLLAGTYGVILLGHLPLLIVHFQQLWSRPHYQFFPVVLLAFAYFTGSSWPHRRHASPGARLLSRGLLLLCGGLLALAFLKISPTLAMISFVLAMAAVLLGTGIPAWGPWCLLWLLIRIPYGQDVALIQWMQRLTTGLSSTALDALRIEHLTEGNVIEFPTDSLFVEEACSGVVSAMAIVACGAIFALWARRSWLHAILLCLAGVLLAGAMNVLRVVSVAYALDQYDVNLLLGWKHDALGLVIFAVCLGGLLSTDRLLLFALSGIRMNPMASYWQAVEDNPLVSAFNRIADPPPAIMLEEEDEPSPATFRAAERPAEPPRPPLLGPLPEMALAAVFLLLGGAQVVAGIGPFAPPPTIAPAALQLAEESLPQELAGWRRVDFHVEERDSFSAFGEHSRTWTYQRDGVRARVSLDFAFPEFHALTACYAGIGWTRKGSDSYESGPDGLPYIEADFSKPDGEQAFLIFELFDAEGKPATYKSSSMMHPKLRRILDGESTPWSLPTYYQTQALLAVQGDEAPEDVKAAVRELFFAFRQQMLELVVGGVKAE